MVDVAARHASAAEAVEAEVLAVLRSGAYVGGPVVARAEAEAARWMGRSGAVGTGSGTDALMFALQAVGVGPGDDVLVPAISFFATAGAVCAIGARPVVVDVDERGCLDVVAAERAWTPRTRAVVPVHLFGNRADAPELDGVVVVDDAAQAIGADPPCSTGRLTALSAYPTKTWSAAGDAGFVVGDDHELLEDVRRLGRHGSNGVAHLHDRVGNAVGRNSRLDAVQAAVLLGHATQLADRVARRRAIAARYDAGLPEAVRPLSRDPGHPVHQYVVRVAERDRVVEALASRGIETRVYYPRGLHRQPALAACEPGPCPVADVLCAEVLALPVHALLSDADVDAVIEALWTSS